MAPEEMVESAQGTVNQKQVLLTFTMVLQETTEITEVTARQAETCIYRAVLKLMQQAVRKAPVEVAARQEPMWV